LPENVFDSNKDDLNDMKTNRRYYRVDRRQINLIRFTFEAYEGVAVVTTLDAAAGNIMVCIAPGCEPVASEIMDDLSRRIHIEPAGPPTD
jgi:hypothetical protein